MATAVAVQARDDFAVARRSLGEISRWVYTQSRHCEELKKDLGDGQEKHTGIPTSSSIMDNASEGVGLHQPPNVANPQAHHDVNEDAFVSDGFQDGGSEAFAGQAVW